MVAGHERPADRFDQFAGQEPSIIRGCRRREQNGEFGARHTGDDDVAAVGIGLSFDPSRGRLQDGIADRAAEGGIDRVVTADREQKERCRYALFEPLPSQSGPRA